MDEGDDWTDESTWSRANPNLGVSVDLDDLRRKVAKAKETPAAVANLRRKHMNQETESSNPWLSTDEGTPCEVSGNTISHGWMAAVLVAPEFWWFESASSSDLVIRDNKIVGCRRPAIEVIAPGGNGKPLPSGAHHGRR